MSAVEQLSHFSHPQLLSICHTETNCGKVLPADLGKHKGNVEQTKRPMAGWADPSGPGYLAPRLAPLRVCPVSALLSFLWGEGPQAYRLWFWLPKRTGWRRQRQMTMCAIGGRQTAARSWGWRPVQETWTCGSSGCPGSCIHHIASQIMSTLPQEKGRFVLISRTVRSTEHVNHQLSRIYATIGYHMVCLERPFKLTGYWGLSSDKQFAGAERS